MAVLLPTRYKVLIRSSAASARRAPSITTPHPWSPPMTSTAIRIKMLRTRTELPPAPGNGLTAGGDGDDLASLVVPASGAYPVRHIWRGALRTSAELRQPQDAVVRPAHALAAFGRFSLRD